MYRFWAFIEGSELETSVFKSALWPKLSSPNSASSKRYWRDGWGGDYPHPGTGLWDWKGSEEEGREGEREGRKERKGRGDKKRI